MVTFSKPQPFSDQVQSPRIVITVVKSTANPAAHPGGRSIIAPEAAWLPLGT